MASQHNEDSLPSLPLHLQSDTHLTAHLASRYHIHLPTARLSSQAVIALNTYTSATRGQNGGEEGSGAAAVTELASRAWARLGHRAENQAVLFLGESGSGKTTLRSHLLSSLLSFSSTPLSNKLSFASFIFDSLTTTKSATTPSASKAGLFFELQYETGSATHPTLIGGKILDHRLERSRISSVPTGERNFHILYYLLQGAGPHEQEHLGLSGSFGSTAAGAKKWRYLGHPAQLKAGINDADGFKQFIIAMRKLEFPQSEIAEVCQILATILHLGQLEFHTTSSTTPKPDDSGGYSHEGGEDITTVKNRQTLSIISAFLGVSEEDLENSFGYKTRTLHRDRVTVMLDPAGAQNSADELARSLYVLLVAWIMEAINERICASEEVIHNTISVVDFPGFAKHSSSVQILDQLLTNAANEQLYNVTLTNFFERQVELLDTEEVIVPPTSYFDNSDTVRGLLKPGNGLLSILDDQGARGRTDRQFLDAIRRRFEGKNPSISVESSMGVMPGSNFATRKPSASFTVRHYAGEADYPVDGLLEANAEIIAGDMLNMMSKSRADFVRELFGQDALNKTVHPQERSAVMQASVASKPRRMPSMARRKHDKLARSARNASAENDRTSDEAGSRTGTFVGRKGQLDGAQPGVSSQFLTSLQNITQPLTAPHTNPYFVFCLKPNERRIANQFDSKCVRQQLQTYGIAEISARLRNADFTVFMPFTEFLSRTESDAIFIGNDREKAENVIDERRWPSNEARCGITGVFLSERCWLEIANIPNLPLRSASHYHDVETDDEGMTPGDRGFDGSNVHLVPSQSPGFYTDDKAGNYFGLKHADLKSETGLSALNGDLYKNLETRSQMAEKANEKGQKLENIEEHPQSGSRKRWVFFVWCLTFYIPDFLISWIGKRKRKDVRMAWREKFAINLLIWFSIAFVMFFMVGLPALICPKQDVYSPSELTSYNGKDGNSAYVAMRGIVYDLTTFAPKHYPSIVTQTSILKYAGLDATNLFPVQVSALCNGVNGTIDEAVQLDYRNSNYSNSNSLVSSTDLNAQYHDFRWFTNDSRPDWWWEQQYTLKHSFWKGNIGYSSQYLKTLATSRNSIASIHGKVYDMTSYIAGGRTPQYGYHKKPSTAPNSNFMANSVVSLFQNGAGTDISRYWEALEMDADEKSRMKVCLDNLFYVGDVDTRNSTQCLFAKYILLAISILLCSVIGFKFLAALQFGKKTVPENLDRFIICTIPAYTEDEESLRRAIDSAARMRYDDKRKLLLIVCDGYIIGHGNDRPTPRIVLDILGVAETVDPEALSFESLGEGRKQHNMGKVYSGLYEVQGHIVPFVVVVKTGKPSEVQKPGNRGKRDSQMILMRFLNRVHYNLEMTPMELELHHQIRNIIGVNPTFYEFVLQIDADTVVAPDAATRMVASMVNDTNIIGLCGETALTNAKASATTAIQVYEYYISHNLTKAFESLFGSVTCLPGCFSMYRVRAADTGKPLFVSKEVVEQYATIRVDTLHTKNLLHLGEDRFLTTLLMKHHPKYKTKYLFRAHAWTIAPETWSVFMSQRRRWINSTVHNLIELMPLQQLCGFCCFSMRFIVFVDLLSTIVQPTIVGYIAYLIYLVVSNSTVVPVTAFILLGAIYGLQAIIFIIRRKWEMIGWMLIYVVATPIFACALPLYSFWRMDDFSWGNTRVVTGDQGQKVVVSDEGKFNPAEIPKKRWEDYQAELWDAQTQHDDVRSEISGYTYATKQMAGSAMGSPYAHGPFAGSEYNLPSRPVSQLELPRVNSRLSLAPSQTLGGEFSEMELQNLPSDDALLAEIRNIIGHSDLMSITKKTVRVELEKRFQCNLAPKREYIGYATESVIRGAL